MVVASSLQLETYWAEIRKGCRWFTGLVRNESEPSYAPGGASWQQVPS